jgi:hypothetical protein
VPPCRGPGQSRTGRKRTSRSRTPAPSCFTCRGTGVADPGCFLTPITDLGYRIQKQQQKRRVKKECCPTFFSNHKNHKIENYNNFELVKKKIWANLQRIIELSIQKIVIKLSKIWVWDPGYGIQGSKRHRIPDPDPQLWGELIKIQAVTITPVGTFYTFLFQRKQESFKGAAFFTPSVHS